MIATKDWQSEAVLVLGFMRSGTTMLLSLLDGHPDLLVYPVEPSYGRLFQRTYQSTEHLGKDFIYGTGNPLHLNLPLQSTDFYPKDFNYKGGHPIPADFSIPPEDKGRLIEKLTLQVFDRKTLDGLIDLQKYHALLEEIIDGEQPGEQPVKHLMIGSAKALLESLKTALAPTAWAFKEAYSEIYKLKRDKLDHFFKYFPRGKCLIIIRDPRGHYNSLIKYVEKRRGGPSRGLWKFRRRVSKLKQTANNYRELHQAFESFDRERFKLVFYEDILNFPRKEMEDIAAYLHIEFDPILTEPTMFGHPISVGTAREGYGHKIELDLSTAWQRDLSWLEIAILESQLPVYFSSPKNPHASTTGPLSRWIGKVVFSTFEALLFIRARFQGKPS